MLSSGWIYAWDGGGKFFLKEIFIYRLEAGGIAFLKKQTEDVIHKISYFNYNHA